MTAQTHRYGETAGQADRRRRLFALKSAAVMALVAFALTILSVADSISFKTVFVGAVMWGICLVAIGLGLYWLSSDIRLLTDEIRGIGHIIIAAIWMLALLLVVSLVVQGSSGGYPWAVFSVASGLTLTTILNTGISFPLS